MHVRRSIAVAVLGAVVALGMPAAALPGDTDPTFSNDGRTVVDIPPWTQGMAVAMQGTKIVVGGTRDTPTGDMVIARLTKRGALDTTFGKGGIVRVAASGEGDWLEDLVVAPDGRIVAVGGAMVAGSSRFLVVRLTVDGRLDPTFGGDGIVTTVLAGREGSAETVTLLPDGRVVVAGAASDLTTTSFAVVRYRPGGGRDRTFSGDGIAFATFPGAPYAIVEDIVAWRSPADHLLAVGLGRDGAEDDIAVASFAPDGKRDAEFGGGDGKTLVSVGPRDIALSVVLQELGNFLAVGSTNASGSFDSMFVRFNASGHIDYEWGDMGVVTHTPGVDYEYWSGAVATGKKIVMVGGYMETAAIMRIRANGSLDDGFGDGGYALVPFDGGASRFRSVAVQDDGLLVAAGFAPDSTEVGFGVARLLP